MPAYARRCKEGEALNFIQDGHIELDGELPLNTFGGSLGTGRIHGLWHIICGALQASGRADRASQGRQRVIRRRQRPDRTGSTFIFVRYPYEAREPPTALEAQVGSPQNFPFRVELSAPIILT
jgi:hypothetical protein